MKTPRILMLIDVYGWAFHTLARGMRQFLPEYSIDIVTAEEKPDFSSYDLIHAFGAYQRCESARCPVLKGVYNTNASIRSVPIHTFFEELLQDATAITVPINSIALQLQSYEIKKPIFLLPEGVNTSLFSYTPPPSGELRIGWAGNPVRCYKRFHLAQNACRELCPLQVADGTLTEEQMLQFYSSLDVILCTSEIGEGCPRPLIEGMSRGCFPVSFPVGVAPDIITSEKNGLLVEKETVWGMRQAIRWCKEHTDAIRSQRNVNHEWIHNNRSWQKISPQLSTIYQTLLGS
ncbi:MAG: glycosyltransferase [Candidatus Peribacter sp.]|jgi:hypothetical protein|nr:glycosyltransferase [Candidatus Peribacter sp.]MBT4392624.1 glycosyltransferase [Candidatus Peribacter sp.]MBT4601107.1 glycosyltransferase [Candidatus Peribacter sp.]MBT5149506.1 glycosyltransferase [Candidatus Peribacter sp.]MBT5638647.1 glycosyltransferase [Candidatus Peribacter sp.]